MLVGMDREKFVDRLAYHYDAFNYIHPFREGNGRTQRLLRNRVARDAGWGLDWRSVHGQTNDNASRIAIEKRDLGPLKQMFDQVVTAGTPARAHDAAWRAVELARASFPRSAVEDVHRRGSLGERPRTRPTSPDLGRGTEGMGR